MNRTMLAGLFLVLPTLSGASHAGSRTLTIDDFEHGDRRAASGPHWISIADDLMGGTSHADLEVVPGGTGSSRVLKVSGEVAPDGFAGAWVALDGRGRATDVSDFAGLRLRIRGAGSFQVALRAGPMAGFNYAAPVEARGDWAPVDVSFESLQPQQPGSPAFDRRSVRWIGVSTARSPAGRFELEIDDVQLYASRDDAQLRVQDGPTRAVFFKTAPSSELPKGRWKELAGDAPDDGKQKRLPDATAVAVCPDDAHGRVWIRVALAGPVPERWLGVNLALDTDGDPNNGMAWWGTNKAFRFDRLVTAYGSVTGSGYEGMVGIADSSEVQEANLMGSKGEQVSVVLDRAHPAIILGIPRSALGGSSTSPARLVAAVGSAFQHNDDVPNEGAALLAR